MARLLTCPLCGQRVQELSYTKTLDAHNSKGELDYNKDTRCPASFKTFEDVRTYLEE